MFNHESPGGMGMTTIVLGAPGTPGNDTVTLGTLPGRFSNRNEPGPGKTTEADFEALIVTQVDAPTPVIVRSPG